MFPTESLARALANVIWSVDMAIVDDEESLREVVRLGSYIDGVRDGYLDGWIDRQRA